MSQDDECNTTVSEVCTYSSTDLWLYPTRLNTYWDDHNPTRRIPYTSWNTFICLESLAKRWNKLVHPCLNPSRFCANISVVLRNSNIFAISLEKSSNKLTVKCFDTSKVLDMEDFFRNSNTNANLSSWNESVITNIKLVFVKKVCLMAMILAGM